MYELLTASAGKNDLDRLQRYFTDPKYEISTGPMTIDMMVFDTAAHRLRQSWARLPCRLV